MMKDILKRFSKKPALQLCVSRLIAGYMRFVFKTSSLTLEIDDACKPYFSGEENALFAMWHNRIMLVQAHHANKRVMHALMSAHSDGKILGQTLSCFDIVPIHGSTSKDGAKALKNIVRCYRDGGNISITPDGPRGPVHRASQGIAQCVMLTKAPLICISCASTRIFRLKSWDRFMIALPFSRLYFAASMPLYYTPDDTMDKYAQRELLRSDIENELNRVSHHTDVLAGIT